MGSYDIDLAMRSYMYLLAEQVLSPADVAGFLRAIHQVIRRKRVALKELNEKTAEATFQGEIGYLDIIVDDLKVGRVRVGSEGLLHAVSAYKEALELKKPIELFNNISQNFSFDQRAGLLFGAIIEVHVERGSNLHECEQLFEAGKVFDPSAILYQAIIYARLKYLDVENALKAVDDLESLFDENIVNRLKPRLFNHFIGLCPDVVVSHGFLISTVDAGYKVDPGMLVLHMWNRWNSDHNFEDVLNAFLLYVHNCNTKLSSSLYPVFDLCKIMFDGFPTSSTEGIKSLQTITQTILEAFDNSVIPSAVFNALISGAYKHWHRRDICDILVSTVTRAGIDSSKITYISSMKD